MRLTKEQQCWVDENLAKMTIEEKIGHLICPEDRSGYTVQTWIDIMTQVPLGTCFFTGHSEAAEVREKIKTVQSMSRNVPLLVAGDLGEGANALQGEEIHAMRPMLVGAADDEELAYQNGRNVARQYRSAGFNWAFSPVVDLLYNFRNGITMNRSYGDSPQRVATLAGAYIRGLQEDGLLAGGAKHFPGDGIDDRDQHRVTSANTLPFDDWMQTYGYVWKSVIKMGVNTIMSGHISLPDYQGFADHPEDALPATLCSKLQIELLRKELGFKGLIVSDAAPMIGITSRVHREKMAIQNIASGGDVFLFAEPVEDFKRLLKAVQTGELQEERVNDACRRVLETKARVNLHKKDALYSQNLTETDKEDIRATNRQIALKGATIQKNQDAFPVDLKPSAKVLCVTVQRHGLVKEENTIGVFAEELRQRGYQVDYLFNPGHGTLNDAAGNYDAIFVNFLVQARALQGLDNLGDAIMTFWRCFYVGMKNVFFTSFGSPYMEYEMPSVPNLLCLYGDNIECQEAAVKIWLGEAEARGTCPVRIPKLRIAKLNTAGN